MFVVLEFKLSLPCKEKTSIVAAQKARNVVKPWLSCLTSHRQTCVSLVKLCFSEEKTYAANKVL